MVCVQVNPALPALRAAASHSVEGTAGITPSYSPEPIAPLLDWTQHASRLVSLPSTKTNREEKLSLLLSSPNTVCMCLLTFTSSYLKISDSLSCPYSHCVPLQSGFPLPTPPNHSTISSASNHPSLFLIVLICRHLCTVDPSILDLHLSRNSWLWALWVQL